MLCLYTNGEQVPLLANTRQYTKISHSLCQSRNRANTGIHSDSFNIILYLATSPSRKIPCRNCHLFPELHHFCSMHFCVSLSERMSCASLCVTPISFPESSFLLTSGRKTRALGATILNNKGNNRILPIQFHCAVCIYSACLKWLLPELSFPTTGQGERRLWERDWCHS